MVDRELLMQAGVSAKDVERLDLAWNAFQAATIRDASHTPCVVCTGIYNAGKSTLLNALIGKDIFPTGDIPTTKAVARAEHGGAVYIDTPGLNAEDEDDRETQSAYGSADFILFVSNAQNGGVSAAEAEWLKKLGERYTADSLKQRLIYVLSHSAQVEPEELSGIEARIRGDLEKAVGFVLEQVLCVDSILFQQGREQEEAILVEDSGIPQLQAYLSKQLAGAEETLRQAHEAEFAQRRQELSEALDGVRLTVQQAYDEEHGQAQTKTAEVDAAWEEFEKALKEAVPSTRKTSPISICIHAHIPSGDTRKENSIFAAKSAAESALRSFYERELPRCIEREAKEAVNRIREYSNYGLNSVYQKTCGRINQVFDQSILVLQKMGADMSPIDEISIVPEHYLCQNLADQVYSTIVQSSHPPRSLRSYVDDREPLEDVDYVLKKGLKIGGDYKRITRYYCQIWAIGYAIQCDVQKAVNEKADWVNNNVSEVWQDFCSKLEPEVNKRKSALKAQVDAYKKSLGVVSPDVEKALSHVSDLKKEATL